MFVISVGFLGAALIGVEAMFLQRWRMDVTLVERLPLDRRSQRVSWPDCYRASETRCEE